VKGEKPNSLTISSIRPNPVRSFLNLVIDAPGRNNISIVISDLSGKVIDTRGAGVETGNNTITIEVSRLNAGIYMVKLVCENGCGSVTRFLKQ
jgi:hypothetical protein